MYRFFQLDWDRLTTWRQDLHNSCCKLARAADCSEVHPKEGTNVLLALLKKEELFPVIGGPTSGDFSIVGSTTPYAQWLMAIWGRRCSYFLGQLARGLGASARLFSDSTASELASNLHADAVLLGRAFGTKQFDKNGAALRLRSAHDICLHHVTYLDPKLFSTLIYLVRHYPHVAPEKWSGTEYSILIKLLKSELCIYITAQHQWSQLLVDASTGWWGMVELLRRMRENFSLRDCKGLGGAMGLIKSILLCECESIKHPTKDHAKSEATFEIHTESRTRLLLLKNFIDLITDSALDEQFRNGSAAELASAIARHATWVMDCYHPPRSGREHVYFNGLGLEVATRLCELLPGDQRLCSAAMPLLGPIRKQDLTNMLRGVYSDTNTKEQWRAIRWRGRKGGWMHDDPSNRQQLYLIKDKLPPEIKERLKRERLL